MVRRVSSLKSFLFLAVVLAFIISPITAEGTDYYVDGVNGNDGNDGSQANPWKTITYAISQASGTDTIYVKYATYYESVNLTPLTKRNINLIGIADGDTRPIISSSGHNIHTIWLVNYTGKIEGLEITGASNANGVNCIASNDGTNTAQITDCKVHGNHVGIHANAVGNTDNCSPYIYRNFIYSNTERGIGNMGYSSATIEGNYIYQNGSGSEGDGGIGNRDNSTATIINNIIYSNDRVGISIRDNANPEIINNTIAYHTASAGNGISVTGISSVVIVNNIITYNKCGLVSKDQGDQPQPCSGNDYNDVWNNSLFDYIGFTKGSNDISYDPLFVDPKNRDYHLRLASPCINAGTSEGAPATDFEGDTRPQGNGYDIGADENVTVITGSLVSGLGSYPSNGGYIEAFAEDYSHEHWLLVRWTRYNSANGEARIAMGDIDGDGKDEIVIGLGPVSGNPSIPGGYFEVLDDDYPHLTWGRINWSAYNRVNGESLPACGDVDGDGEDEIIIGLGPGGGGWFEVFDYTSNSVTHKDWKRVNWNSYNRNKGETRPALGDIDDDGKDEIIVGLGSEGGGWLEIFDDADTGYVHLDWIQVNWGRYNSINGETRPALGDIDDDGKDEIIVGLGSKGGGWLEIFDDADTGYVHLDWIQVNWGRYNSINGETRPALGDIDDDGKDEIIVGLGSKGGGWLEIFDDADTGYVHLDWIQVNWGRYNRENGETWPAIRR